MVTRGRKSKGGHQAGSCSSGESQASGDASRSGKEKTRETSWRGKSCVA